MKERTMKYIEDLSKYAFDLHGVLETYPDKFKPLLSSLNMDDMVIILSGPPYAQIMFELDQLGYYPGEHFDYIISVVDWLKEKGIPMERNVNGSWYCDEENWWSSKAKICAEEGVDILFDNDLRYKDHIINGQTLFMHIK